MLVVLAGSGDADPDLLQRADEAGGYVGKGRRVSVTPGSCVDCGVRAVDRDHLVMLVQVQVVAGKTIHFKRCARCFLTRGQQDQAEMREQLELSMKTKTKVA